MPRKSTARFEGLESLEQRLVMATYTWDGLGDGVSITDRANWHNNHLPGPDDTAIIQTDYPLDLVLNGGLFEVNSLVLNQHLTITDGRLSVFSTSQVDGKIDLAGGEFNGGGDINIAGTLNWNAGKIAGAGDIVVQPGGTLRIEGSGPMNLERDIVNHGTTRWISGDLIGAGSAGTVINNASDGVFKSTGQTVLKAGYWPAAFINQGTFVRDGDGTAGFLVPFHNSGTLNVASGTLLLSAGGSNSGPRNVAAGALLHYFGDFTENAGSTLAGGGMTIWQGGTHTINGDWSMDSYLTLSNATVAGPGNWTIDGVLLWSHGTLSGHGGTVIGESGKIEIRSLGEHVLARDIDNNGVLLWNRGPLTFGGATVTNNANFYVAAADSVWSTNPDDLIVNHGQIRKVLPTTAGFGGVTLDTDGTVNAHNGTLSLPHVAQVADSVLTGGNWIIAPTGTLDMGGAQIHTIGAAASVTRIGVSAGFSALSFLSRNDGALRILGGGTVALTPDGGDFINAGLLVLDHSTTLDIDGGFVQTATGVTEVGIVGPGANTAGNIHASSATLDGVLTLSFKHSYIPAPGTQYVVIQAPSIAGTFWRSTRTAAPAPCRCTWVMRSDCSSPDRYARSSGVTVTCRRRPARSTVSSTGVPAAARARDRCRSSTELTILPATSTIRSSGFRPARAAGERGSTPITCTAPSLSRSSSRASSRGTARCPAAIPR
jgi:hypothetical protein